MNRNDALVLVHEYVQNPLLVRHMLAVEAVMRAYARKLGADEERWGMLGLVHGFGYERWPSHAERALRSAEILRERGCPEEVIYAIQAQHGVLAGCPRVHPMDKALYALDDLTMLVMATAQVRPNGLADMTADSVRKKMKLKGFAPIVNRAPIEQGGSELGVPLNEHIDMAIAALKSIAKELGLLEAAVSPPTAAAVT